METHLNWKVLFTKLKFTIKNWFTLGWFNIIDTHAEVLESTREAKELHVQALAESNFNLLSGL